MTVSLQKGLSKKKESNKGDLTERLKVLAEFQGVVEHQQFMSSIIKEREIKTRIRDLTRYTIYPSLKSFACFVYRPDLTLTL